MGKLIVAVLIALTTSCAYSASSCDECKLVCNKERNYKRIEKAKISKQKAEERLKNAIERLREANDKAKEGAN